MADVTSNLRVYVNMPDALAFKHAKHRDWLDRSLKRAAGMYAKYGVAFVRNPLDATLLIDVTVGWNIPNVNRGRGMRLSPGRGNMVLDFQSFDYPAIIGKEILTCVVTHELGHIFGLAHCHKADCVMTKAEIAGFLEVIWAYITKGLRLCGECVGLLKQIVADTDG